MTSPNVLVLHGPLHSSGINPVTQTLFTDSDDRARARTVYDCTPVIVANCAVFRSLGCRIVYSGWLEDRAWLEENRTLFDVVVISDQSRIRSEDVLNGVLIPNNKDKLYYGALRGLQVAVEHWGPEAPTLRMRSDVSVHPELLLGELAKVVPGSGRLLIEYLNVQRMFWMPDFMVAGAAGLLQTLYQGMFQRAVTGRGYHISSHVEHAMSCIDLVQQGLVSQIISMGRATYESLVWRGIPRYLERALGDQTQHLAFDAGLEVPPGLNVEAVVNAQPEELTGRKRYAS